MMILPDQSCDPRRIDDYLDERLNKAMAMEFERHLCDCQRCRDELQRRSAGSDVWRDAVALLSPDLASGLTIDSNDRSSSGELANEESRTCQRQLYVLSVLDSLAPTDDPEMLGRIGYYEISGVIGVGGMGAVLKGFDKSLRRVVAIKVMAPHLAHSGSARTRFQREARAAAAITHDNVIDIYAVSEAAGLPYLVMPYARGPSLQKRIDEGGPLGVVEIVRIGRQIAAGLAAAHEQGVVHRDIKPANILLSDGIERLWITDFGVARAMDDASMTQTGLIAGTPQYMSPEQARGESVDHRSDLFSLGSVLYTACTGRPPFRSEAAYGILRRITDSDPRPIREINPDIPEWLCSIIARLQAKHPADRFESAGEVVELLDGCLAHLQQPLQVELPSLLRGNRWVVDSAQTGLAADINLSSSGFRFAQPDQTTHQTQPVLQPQRFFAKRGFIMTGSILLAGILGFVTMQLTAPTDISGHWTGENWQHVSLASVDEASHWYSGTFVDSTGRRGAVRLEWSRLHRRYNGRWKVGEAEAGDITLRAGQNRTLLGAIAIDPESQLEPDTPRLLEFAWQPASKEAQQNFESQASQSKSDPSQRKPQSVSVRSPIKGVVVRIVDGIDLNAGVKEGDLIAEIEPTDSASIHERQQQLVMLQRKSEVAKLRIIAAKRDFGAAKQICAAIEAQIKTLETAKQQAAAAFKAGLDQQTAELQAQSNLDNSIVALKKAEADVVKAETELQLAEEDRVASEREIQDLQVKLQQVERVQILAPVDGKFSYIATSTLSSTVKEGDVLCELIPDSAPPTESPENAKNPLANPAPTIATTPAPMTTSPVAEPKPSSSLQSLSAFGPASELAKRLRESRHKSEKIASEIEAAEAKLLAIQQKLLDLQEKQKLAEQDDVQLRNQLESQSREIEATKQATEQEIEKLRAEAGLAHTEFTEAEYEKFTIFRLLENQLSSLQSQLEIYRSSREQMELKHQQGLISREELNQTDQRLVETESEIRQLELLIDFYARLGK